MPRGRRLNGETHGCYPWALVGKRWDGCHQFFYAVADFGDFGVGSFLIGFERCGIVLEVLKDLLVLGVAGFGGVGDGRVGVALMAGDCDLVFVVAVELRDLVIGVGEQIGDGVFVGGTLGGEDLEAIFELL